MAKRKSKRFGSSAATHMKRGKASVSMAQNRRVIFRAAMKAGDCRRALEHLVGAARELGRAAGHGESFKRRGGKRSMYANRRPIESMSREFFHACVTYR